MKKKWLLLTLAVVLCFGFVACGNESPEGNNNEQPEATPPDLAGDWVQINSNSEDNYHIATIQDDIIEIYWYDSTTETKSLYWAGTYEAPATADEPYTWDSANDREKTDSSLLASSADTKPFTYEDRQIRYEASALGTTQTIRLEQEK